MTTTTGTVRSVEESRHGSHLAVDAAVNATVLTLDAATPFTPTGGRVDLNGTPTGYTKADPEAGTLTLTTPLAVALEAGFPVWDMDGDKIAATIWATIHLDDPDAEPVLARVPTPMRGWLSPARDYDVDPAQVTLELVAGTWEVVDQQPGQSSTFDGSTIDPATLPATSAPAPLVAPTSSPALTVTGQATSLVVQAGTVAATDLIQYHVSTVDGFAPSATTALGSPTRATVNVVTALPDDTPLVVGTVYYLRAVASNASGTAPSSAQATGQLDTTAISELIAEKLVAGFILAGAIRVGNITIDADTGITIPGPDGNSVLPVDGSEMHLLAKVIATYLTVKDGAALGGLVQILQRLVVANGVVDPTQAPVVTATWPALALAGADTGFCGLTDTPDGASWLSVRGTDQITVQTWDKATGLAATPVSVSLAGSPRGVARLGGLVYVLTVFGGIGRVYTLDPAQNYASVGAGGYFQVGSAYGFPSDRLPALGTDGTNLLIGSQLSTNGRFLGQVYNTAGARLSSTEMATGFSGMYDMAGVYLGSADFGAQRWVFATATGNTIVYDAAGVKQDAQGWGRAANVESRGLFWDGARFRGLGADRMVYTHGAVPTARTVYGAYDWADSAGLHTKASPVSAAFNQPARTFLRVEGQPAPEASDASATAASLVRLYAGTSATATRLQASPARGTRVAVVDTLAVATTDALAPTTYTFTARAPGSLESTALDANGLPRWKMGGGGAEKHDDIGTLNSGSVGVGTFRDSVRALGEIVEVTQTANAVPNSTTNVTLPGISQTVTATAATNSWWVTLQPDAQLASGTSPLVVIELLVDGALYGTGLALAGPVGLRMALSKGWVVTGLTTGNHTITAQTRMGGASTSATIRAITTLITQRIN